MSSTAWNYRQVICECPNGHLLGTIIETQTGLWWGERPLRNERNVETISMPRGEKVKATCVTCSRAADYQASWRRVAAKLDEARNTRAERVTLVFG